MSIADTTLRLLVFDALETTPLQHITIHFSLGAMHASNIDDPKLELCRRAAIIQSMGLGFSPEGSGGAGSFTSMMAQARRHN
jgi:hypothetical protein